jgi:hypothetical protein
VPKSSAVPDMILDPLSYACDISDVLTLTSIFCPIATSKRHSDSGRSSWTATVAVIVGAENVAWQRSILVLHFYKAPNSRLGQPAQGLVSSPSCLVLVYLSVEAARFFRSESCYCKDVVGERPLKLQPCEAPAFIYSQTRTRSSNSYHNCESSRTQPVSQLASITLPESCLELLIGRW